MSKAHMLDVPRQATRRYLRAIQFSISSSKSCMMSTRYLRDVDSRYSEALIDQSCCCKLEATTERAFHLGARLSAKPEEVRRPRLQRCPSQSLIRIPITCISKVMTALRNGAPNTILLLLYVKDANRQTGLRMARKPRTPSELDTTSQLAISR